MEMEPCIRRDGEDIPNYFQWIKRNVTKRWPKNMNGIANAQQAAERAAQARENRQRSTRT